jgi:hypothetical protein
MNKSEIKTGVDRNVKALRDKAQELRRRMSAEKAAAIVSRLEDPSDSGDLSQQSHEEWLFLNRNNLEKSLLREVEEALRASPTAPTASARSARADLAQRLGRCRRQIASAARNCWAMAVSLASFPH